MFGRYLINGKALETGQGHLHAARPYPWWEVPRALVDTLHADDPTTAIDNLLQWLRENHADLYFAYPERSLQCAPDASSRKPSPWMRSAACC